MPFIQPAAGAAQPNLAEASVSITQQVQQLTCKGWRIAADGPTGVQLIGPKAMRGLDKACLALGILTFWLYGIGFIFILISMLDYWLMTKPETKFIAR